MKVDKVALRYEISNAQMLYRITPSKMEVSLRRGSIQIKSDNIKLKLDNRGFFDSINIKTIASLAQENVQKGKQAALDAASRYTREKNAMIGPDAISQSQIVAQREIEPILTELTFVPVQKPQIGWSGGTLQMAFSKDDLQINWHPYDVQFTYIPYSVEYYVDKW